MTDLVLERSDPHMALSHLALYGLGAILEDAGQDVRLSWTTQLRTRPCLSGAELDTDQVGQLVREHAARLAEPGRWLTRDIALKGTARGLMSPRLTQFPDRQTWEQVQQGRHDVLDELTRQRRALDLRMLAALGEPAYWSRNDKDQILQDDGASRWEMQPRNKGSEIVGSRLRKLAAAVAERSPAAVVDGLRGTAVRDEIGDDKPDSRTPTGLGPPGPTDNALAWCALWGMSQLPIAMRVSTGRRHRSAATTGHVGRGRSEWFYTPVWHPPWRPSRLRTILASAQLRTVASVEVPLPAGDQPSPVAIAGARRWLSSRGVAGVMRFPIERFGSDNAPERRAMRGEPVAVTM